MRNNKKYISIDFDGVIHSYSTKWQGINIIPDLPVVGAIEFLLDLERNGFGIIIFSTRCKEEAGIKAMKEYLVPYLAGPLSSYSLAEKFVDKIEFAREKPTHADAFIDDRAIPFSGTFPSMEYLKEFDSWVKKIKEK